MRKTNICFGIENEGTVVTTNLIDDLKDDYSRK